MKVLVIHCAYQFKGGEDTVVEEEMALLRANGVEVALLPFSNEKNKLQKILQLPFNYASYKTTLQKIKAYQPDIVHIHNLHFSASPSVIYAIKKTKTPFVCTLHNYRLLCPSAILFHKGKPFLDSVQQSFPWKAVVKGVYKHSRLLTFWMAVSMQLHQWAKTWQQCNRFIVLTQHAKEIFLQSKLKLREDQVVVKPNFCFLPALPPSAPQNYFLYVGRLSEEKGIPLLLEVFATLPYRLKIAGDGPLKEKVIAACGQYKNIEFEGMLKKEDLLPVIANASALLFPSIWFEGMPLTIIESFALGTPIIASRLGAMDDMVTPHYNGLHFEAGSATSLQQAITKWVQLPEEEKKAYRQHAVETYHQFYTPQKNAGQLLSIYTSVLAEYRNPVLSVAG